LLPAFEFGEQCRWDTLSQVGKGLVEDLFRLGLKGWSDEGFPILDDKCISQWARRLRSQA
jgi:hypothetical protein